MIKPTQRGFTLIEMMIVVAIIGILAAIAYPSYMAQVQKSRRADAYVALGEIAQRQENYFMRNRSYAKTLAAGAGGLDYGTASPEGQYVLSIAALDQAGGACTGTNADACMSFTLTATAAAGTSQAGDSTCKSILLDNRGTKTAKDSANNASAVCW
jgi:type IV pilus assembly protein PilE